MKEKSNINPIARIIGANIVRHANDRKVTFLQLANEMHVEEETLRRWLTGERMITAYGLVRAARALETTMEELTKGVH